MDNNGSDDVLNVFAGLDEKQAAKLAASMVAFAQSERANISKGDNMITLSSDQLARNARTAEAAGEPEPEVSEADKLVDESINLARTGIASQRSAATQANLTHLFTSKIAEIVSLVEPHRRGEFIDATKTEFRARGLNVDSINFSDNVLRGRADAYVPQEVPDDSQESLLAAAVSHHDRIKGERLQAELMPRYEKELEGLRLLGSVEKRRAYENIKSRYRALGLKGV